MCKKKIILITSAIFSGVFVIANKILEKFHLGIQISLLIVLTVIWIIITNYIYKKYKIAGYDDKVSTEVAFHRTEDVSDHVLKYAVIMSKYNGKWLFVKHRERNTWEIAGGKREINESIIDTARRELIEETGAVNFELNSICVYSVKREMVRSYGLLCYADIEKLDNNLLMEISEVREFNELPENLTYPEIQSKLYSKVNEYIREEVS